jgi:hypothetical protein
MRRSLVGFLVVLALSAGCGNGGTLEPSELSAIRVFNASPDSPELNVLLRGSEIAQGLAYAHGQFYKYVQPGPGEIEVHTTITDDVLLVYDATFVAGTPYTFAITGTAGARQSIFVADDTTAAPSGNFKVRVIQLASLGPAMDLYITDPGADLSTATPVVTGIAYTKSSAYVTEPIGSKQLRATQAGTKTLLWDSTNPVTFTSGQGVTVFLIGAAGTGGGGAPYTGQLVADHSGTN